MIGRADRGQQGRQCVTTTSSAAGTWHWRRAPVGPTLKPGHTIPTGPDLTRARPGRADRRFPAAVPGAGSRTGQRVVRPVDRLFQGQGGTIGSFLAQTAALTNTLADRDELIGQVITNLNTVLGHSATRATSSPRPSTHCPSWSQGWRTASRTSATAWPTPTPPPASVADLLAQARPPLAEDDRRRPTAPPGIVVADHDYFDNLLNTLPDAYQVLARQGPLRRLLQLLSV